MRFVRYAKFCLLKHRLLPQAVWISTDVREMHHECNHQRVFLFFQNEAILSTSLKLIGRDYKFSVSNV